MLSAVAARKARLQSQGVTQNQEPALPVSTNTTPSSLENVRAATKRKPSAATTPKPATRKKRKRTHQAHDDKIPQNNYEDTIRAQEDVVILGVDSDEEDIDIQEFSADDVSSDERPTVSLLPPSRTPVAGKKKRAWSPSTPFDSANDVVEGPSSEIAVPPLTEPLSTFQPVLGGNVFKLSPEETSQILESSSVPAAITLLKPQERLALLGVYKFYVLRGSITFAGVILNPSSEVHHVFAPRSSPILAIEPISLSNSSPEIPFPLPPRLSTIVAQAETAILLQESHTGIAGLGKVHGVFEKNFDPLRWQDHTATSELGISGVQNVQLTRQSNDVYPMIVPQSWEAALSAVEPNSERSHRVTADRCVYLVRGAKKSGKSTFARTLLNRLTIRYRYVAFLECDIGQSEFTPGGMVALNVTSKPMFGPPFTHPSTPYEAHYIGETSPRSSPSHYLDAIRAILHTYETDVKHAGLMHEHDPRDGRIADIVPLVINTMGWTKGLGADLARQTEEMLQPSMIFDIPQPLFDEGFPSTRFAETELRENVQVLEAISPDLVTSQHSAADFRQLSILSYFHATFPSTASQKSIPSTVAVGWDTSLPLCARIPYEIDVSSALDMIALTGAGSEDVVPSELFVALNGGVVGLVSCEPDTLELETQDGGESGSKWIPYVQGAPPPLPSTSACHGLAIIRSVSTLSPAPEEAVQLQILTPLPPSLLASAPPRVIVKGAMELPVWGFLDFRNNEGRVAGVPKGRVPYLRWGKGEGLGGEKRRVRRNLMRKGQQ